MKKSKNRLFRLPKSLQSLFLGVLVFNVLWWIAALIFQNKALPNPIDVYAAFPKAMSQGMLGHSLASLQRIVIGTFFALIFGLIGGILTGTSRRADKLLNPLLYLSYPVPKLALLPIVMILFGIGESAKIIMIVLIIVFQLMISIRDAIRHIDKENFYVLSSLGANRIQQLRHVILPGILPETFSALRVSVGIATSVLFVTETFGTDKGLGFYIVDTWMRRDYLAMYAGIVAISVIGFLLFVVIDVLDMVFCKWKNDKLIEN